MKAKGHHILIKALSLLNHIDFYCIISGDLSKYPAYACEIRNMIAKFKMQKKIRLFGTEMDMKGLYAISDIVLSTSIEPEALGTVALEAQSMERIVIASDIGGSLENIIDSKTGYHFKSGDKNALAEKIEFVLKNLDSSSVLEIKKHARQNIIDNFSLDLMKKTMIKIYQDI